MNVIYFDITITRSKWEKIPIQDLLIKSYKDDFSDPESWDRTREEFWTNLPHKNLKAIYSLNSPIIKASTGNNHYCLFNSASGTSKVSVTLHSLVIASAEDINDVINNVSKDIKRVLNHRCIISKIFRNSVEVDRNNSVYVYPFNSETNDIWDTTYKIKASFNRVVFEKGEKIQLYLISLLSLALFPLYFWSNMNVQYKNVVLGIFTSSIFFCLTVPLAKIDRIFFKKYDITINNLSNFVEKGLALPFSTGTSSTFLNPHIPQTAEPEIATTEERDDDIK